LKIDPGRAVMRPEPAARIKMEKEAVGSGDNTEGPLGKIAGIYRVNSDGTIEAIESTRVEAAEKASLFLTDEGIVVVIGNAAGE
jgi:hypothetical protein